MYHYHDYSPSHSFSSFVENRILFVREDVLDDYVSIRLDHPFSFHMESQNHHMNNSLVCPAPVIIDWISVISDIIQISSWYFFSFVTGIHVHVWICEECLLYFRINGAFVVWILIVERRLRRAMSFTSIHSKDEFSLNSCPSTWWCSCITKKMTTEKTRSFPTIFTVRVVRHGTPYNLTF